jgi:hypothetical protein
MPHPVQSSSLITAKASCPRIMQSLPVLLTGQNVMHSKLHLREWQLSLSRTAILCDNQNAPVWEFFVGIYDWSDLTILVFHKINQIESSQINEELIEKSVFTLHITFPKKVVM